MAEMEIPLTLSESITLNTTLTDVRNARYIRQLVQERRHELGSYEDYYSQEEFKQVATAHLRPARLEDYKAWLAKHILSGGKPNHIHDCAMSLDDWFVANESFELPRLNAEVRFVNIIIPDGVEAKYEDLGNNNLYFMHDGSNKGGYVPIFPDIRFKPTRA